MESSTVALEHEHRIVQKVVAGMAMLADELLCAAWSSYTPATFGKRNYLHFPLAGKVLSPADHEAYPNNLRNWSSGLTRTSGSSSLLSNWLMRSNRFRKGPRSRLPGRLWNSTSPRDMVIRCSIVVGLAGLGVTRGVSQNARHH
jgi:hypothetical protein